MQPLHKPTPEQKRRALASAVALALVALGIYAVVVARMVMQA